MVQLIQMIDAISRQRRMDVLFLAILDGAGRPTRDHPALREAKDWLTAEGFAWQICGAFQQGWIYLGDGKRVIFIDTPYLPGSDTLARLEARFEMADGTPRNPGLVLTVLTLAEAMTNAAQDEPGFWDNI
jgi:hypothetical protein